MLPTFNVGPWQIATCNFLRGLAVLVGALVALLRLRRLGLRSIYLVQAFLFIIPLGLAGSGLGQGIEDACLRLFHAPCPVPLKFSSIVSGLIVGIAAAVVTCQFLRVSVWRALDLGGVAVPLAQAIGRLGCLAAGCCYGRLTDSFLGLYLPDHDGVWQARYPTQLMAAAGDLLIFGALLLIERHGRRRVDGRLALLYLVLFGVKRLALDFLRGDALPPVVGPLNSTQVVCAAGALIAAGLLVWRQRQVNGLIAITNEPKHPKRSPALCAGCSRRMQSFPVAASFDCAAENAAPLRMLAVEKKSQNPIHVHPKYTIAPILSRGDMEAFIRFPFRLYRNDPSWVPPLLSERRRFLDPRHNPYFEHADVALWIARRDDQTVGTISAQVDHLHNQVQREPTGHFGFFEVVEDAEVAALLLTTARDWLAGRGMRVMRGPLSFSRNHGSGLVVAGESRPPMVMTTYTPPYYAGLCERFGLVKAQDSFAYLLDLTQFLQVGELPSAIARFVDVAWQAQAETDLRVRAMTWQTFAADMQSGRQLYQRSFAQNWDFVPVTDAEFIQVTTQLRQILDPAIVCCAELHGELVGMALALPDANQILRRLNGRLFPTGWLKALWLRRSGAITQVRLMDLGVLPEHRRAGIEALLIFETLQAAVLRGYRAIEFSWVLESNAAMNHLITYWGRDFGVRRYRTYRLYEMAL